MDYDVSKLGYYIVGKQKYFSKIRACIDATATRQNVSWHFNDDVFDRFDWTQEPDQTLDQLYCERARALREKYDYIILSYSGGSDSHNILRAFLDNKLHIDEITVNVFEKANKTIDNDPSNNSATNYGAEYKLQIYPRLEEIRHLSPRTKITIIDQSDFLMNELFNPSQDGNWVLKYREPINPSGASRWNYLHHKQLRERVDRSKSVGVIFGIEKPNTFIDHDGTYKLKFVDSSANLASADVYFGEYDNTGIEYFYWDPSSAKIVCKQAHIIKKWLELNPQFIPLWTADATPTTPANSASRIREAAMRQELMRTIIYTNWNTDWFQVTKGRLDWVDDLDFWFYTSREYMEQLKTWMRGVAFVRSNAKSFVVNNSLMPFIKEYKIGRFGAQNVI